MILMVAWMSPANPRNSKADMKLWSFFYIISDIPDISLQNNGNDLKSIIETAIWIHSLTGDNPDPRQSGCHPGADLMTEWQSRE
jgi:hypothetical protein